MVERVKGGYLFTAAEKRKMARHMKEELDSYDDEPMPGVEDGDGRLFLKAKECDRFSFLNDSDGQCPVCQSESWGGGNCTKGCPVDGYQLALHGRIGRPTTPRKLLTQMLGPVSKNHTCGERAHCGTVWGCMVADLLEREEEDGAVVKQEATAQ